MKIFIIIAIAGILIVYSIISCTNNIQESNNKVNHDARFEVRTSHDNNWTTSALLLCDSFTYTSPTSIILYRKGSHYTIQAPLIKVFEVEALNY